MKNSPTALPGRDQALAFRLEGHHLAARLPPGSLLRAAGACGLQNTPPGSAALALHARLADLTPGALEQALLQEKSLLQAWSLRAAPRLFPTAQAAVYTLGVLPNDEAGLRFFIYGVEAALDQIGISATETLKLVSAALLEELDGRLLTKNALGAALARRITPRLPAGLRPAWESPSMYAPGQSLGESVARFFLPVAALQGACCHAERRGDQAYYALTGQWLGRPLPERPIGEARAELVRRYLSCYGPSTPNGFAAWSGISPAQASQAWQGVENELVEVQIGGRTSWLLRGDLERFHSPASPSGARFLPPHDPYLEMRDRELLIPERARQRQVWRTSGNPGILLVGGRPAGLWRPQKKGARLSLTVELFEPLETKLQTEVESEAQALAEFRECNSVEVKYNTSGGFEP
jgi:hypothetical protein